MRSGFILLEILIYITCSLLLVGFAAAHSLLLYQHVYSLVQAGHRALSLSIGFERLCNDLCSMPSNKTGWKRCSDNDLIVVNSSGEGVRWFVRHNKLMRAIGSYYNARWHTKTVNVVAEQITSMRCVPHDNNNYITSINCVLEGPKLRLQGFVGLRKGVYL